MLGRASIPASTQQGKKLWEAENRNMALDWSISFVSFFLYITHILFFFLFFTVRNYAAHHEEESFEAFTSRYVTFFDSVEDLFELQRGLNNCFSYDLVPAPEVIESALRASRRVNDYSTAVRVFEGIKEKVENKGQYEKYLEALKPVKDELGESCPTSFEADY